MSLPKSLHIGVAGWSYPQWNGPVYPRQKSRSFHPLESLAKLVDAVEINTSFYQALKPEVSRLWLRKVEANPRFVFTAKLHQRFTHERILDATEIATFKAGLRPLLKSGRLGAVLMQFPWSFRFTQENREFFVALRRAFHEYPLVAEMRHDSWAREEAVGVFIDYHVGFCNIDQPAYTRAMPPTAFLTSRTGYVRLHGRNPANSLGHFEPGAPRAHQHDYLYSLEELAEWKARIDKIHRYAETTVVIFNNDPGAKSVANALALRALEGDRKGFAPAELIRRYPTQLQGFTPDRVIQPSLFQAA